jgi:hypothetical protein
MHIPLSLSFPSLYHIGLVLGRNIQNRDCGFFSISIINEGRMNIRSTDEKGHSSCKLNSELKKKNCIFVRPILEKNQVFTLEPQQKPTKVAAVTLCSSSLACTLTTSA